MWYSTLFHLSLITTPLGEECFLSLDKDIEMVVLRFKVRFIGGYNHHTILNHSTYCLTYPLKPKDFLRQLSTETLFLPDLALLPYEAAYHLLRCLYLVTGPFSHRVIYDLGQSKVFR